MEDGEFPFSVGDSMIFAELTGPADSEFFATVFAFGTLSATSASSPLLCAPRVNLELGQRRFSSEIQQY
jgi:hypothetical protein